MSEQQHKALEPCPFCGSSDVRNVSSNFAGPSNHLHSGDKLFAVNCGDCGASVPNRYRNDLVISAWNRRTSAGPLRPLAFGRSEVNGDILQCITPAEHAKCEGHYTVPLYPDPNPEIRRLHEEIKALRRALRDLCELESDGHASSESAIDCWERARALLARWQP